MQQKVFRIRRNYNRWVANQTLEDYALRFTAKKARKWSAGQVAMTALGAISFLALEAIGGTVTLNYGFSNALAAVLVVGSIIFLTGLPITYYAAKHGIDIDLLTRGAGFGYIGSTITSLIYASFTFIFFALEAAILALALELTLAVPLTIGYIVSTLAVIPLVTHGITWISRFQVWTQPIWILLQLLPLACIAAQSNRAVTLWTQYQQPTMDSEFNLIAFGAAASVMFSLVAQIGEQVDFLRFLPANTKPSKKWWFFLLSAGPGWIIPGAGKILIGSFLAVLAINQGFSFEQAADPNRMYLTAFNFMNLNHELTLLLTGMFVILSQMKINVTNAYAGSIAWSNFFSRLTQNHPGRVVWLVFNVAIGLMLMELGIYQALKEILGGYSIVAVAWVGSLVADLVINKPLGLRPPTMEFKRAHLYDINPVGVGSMLVASVIGFTAYSGFFGETWQAFSSFLALITTFVCAPLIAYLTQGRYYIARQPVIFDKNQTLECCICNHRFEAEDITFCPAYDGHICSLCCSLDGRCRDSCKPNARGNDQIIAALNVILPGNWVRWLNTQIGHFLALFLLINVIIAGVLIVVYFKMTLERGGEEAMIADALTDVFFILLVISGVVSWMFVLVHENRKIAQEESLKQTQLLVDEIEAHRETDFKLQQAKEHAEAANKAKTRYLTGISHELRSPLNAIMGYAQLLEKDSELSANRKNALTIIRNSSEHLADLIEGLLDISRIEAGRLELARNEVHLESLLSQIVGMFKLQAHSKGLTFEYQQLTALPKTVRTDEKRLRQILINLISNAIKYTSEGVIHFSVSYRGQVAVFSVQDSGIGIADEDIERIFQPFVRIRKPGAPHTPGTGLGLTTTRFLTDLMGGDLTVDSVIGEGSLFKVSLMLLSIEPTAPAKVQEKSVYGYEGSEKTVLVVDDEPNQRSLFHDVLTPLGFNVIHAQDASSCMDMLRLCDCKPEIFLLDVTMPGQNGWELAMNIRSQFPAATIIMVSANANEQMPNCFAQTPHNGYLVKPLQLTQLIHYFERYAGVNWLFTPKLEAELKLTLPGGASRDDSKRASKPNSVRNSTILAETSSPDDAALIEMIRFAEIGFAKGLLEILDRVEQKNTFDTEKVSRMRQLAMTFQFSAFIKLVKELI